MALTGQRGTGKVSPRDLTGSRQREIIATRDADKAVREMTAAELGVIKRAEYDRGRTAGYENGFTAGWDALAAHLVEQGILEPDDQDDDE